MPPSILFLVVDCLRADRAFDQARLAPDGFLGRLVGRGTRFTEAVTVTPTTTPAVASMLTGCYPYEHGVRGLTGHRLAPGVETLAGALGAVGYHTEAEVTGPLGPELGLFDEFDSYRLLPAAEASLHDARGPRLAGRIAELQAGGAPWFMLAHLWELHEPRRLGPRAPRRALGRTIYDRALASLDERLAELLPDALLEDVVVCLVGDHGENLRLEPHGRMGNAVAGLLWRRETRAVAQPLARRVIAHGARSSTKRALRLAPRAIITHGHHLLEPLIRVPYILAGPGVPHGASAALVTHVDLAPTLAELAGSWFAGGEDARPLPLHGDRDTGRRVILETAWVTSLAGVRQQGVRTRRWSYMELGDGGSPALFDLERDPSQCRNVLARHPEEAADLREELHRRVSAGSTGGPMEGAERDVVEARLRDLGYFD
jgi:arylsulfatase A-like enzyme